jgi:hypothetical protein
MFHEAERPFERIFYIFGIQITNLYEVAEVVYKVDVWSWKLIICLPEIIKKNFPEVDEAINHGVYRPYELVFCFLGIEKIVLDEVS